SSRLPLQPLLQTYIQAGISPLENLDPLSPLGRRQAAIRDARSRFLSEAVVSSVSDGELQTALIDFYEACVEPALHTATLRGRRGIAGRALGHLLCCGDPLPQKAERCLAPQGAYHVTGLGPAFWSALFQGLDPLRNAAWTPAVETGLRRLGLGR